MGETKIQWTDATWNPVRGCSRVSPGCDHCYAMGQAHRFAGTVNGKPGPFAGLTTLRRGKVDWTGRAVFVPEMLDQPLRWKKPRRIFVNSMSDLFHESLSNEEIAAVFGVMAACPHHMFQVLTKRPKRAAEWFAWYAQKTGARYAPCGIAVTHASQRLPREVEDFMPHLLIEWPAWPLPNVHLGVSVEDQKTADERIPLLLGIPSAVRFVSAEPLLAQINLRPWLMAHSNCCGAVMVNDGWCVCCDRPCTIRALPDWVIVGGESGHGARPFDLAWARSIVDDCIAFGAAIFVKQFGAKPFDSEAKVGALQIQLRDNKGGDMAEWPEALRVRQFPEVRNA